MRFEWRFLASAGVKPLLVAQVVLQAATLLVLTAWLGARRVWNAMRPPRR